MAAVHRFAFPIAIVLIVVYVVLRTAGVSAEILNLWTALACVAALSSPLAGLSVLAALGPFTQALTDDGQITAVPFLIGAVVLSVVIRVIAQRRLPALSVPVVLAAALLVGTALGVAVSFASYGAELGKNAAELWVPGIGGGLIVLLCAWWIGSSGEMRPLFVAAISAALAAAVSLMDYAVVGLVHASPLGWMLREGNTLNRLAGVIPAANPAAMIFLTGFAVSLAYAALGSRPTLRLGALAMSGVCLAAAVLTYSRSGIVAAALVVGVIAWRRWGVGGVLVAVSAGAAAVIGAVFAGAIRSIPIEADTDRIDAWVATVRLWLAHPNTGAGFRSFEWLHAHYGSGYLNAPHNEWLRTFGEEGTFFGLVGVAFAGSTIVSLLRRSGVVATAGACVAVALVVMGLFNNPLIYTQVNVPVFVVIGTSLGALALKREQDHSLRSD